MTLTQRIKCLHTKSVVLRIWGANLINWRPFFIQGKVLESGLITMATPGEDRMA